MRTYPIVISLLLTCSFSAAAGRPGIATYSQGDLARIMTETCGAPPQGTLRLHRNTAGDMLYVACEDHREAVVYGESQQCSKLSDQTLDVWRDDKGRPSAQTIKQDDGVRLMVAEAADLRGKRFDVERSGQYIMTSHGMLTSISTTDKPWRKMVELQAMDGQRIFVRKRNLLVVGNNTGTNKLEARVITVSGESVTESGAIPVGDMPAGVRVLDYAEASDELLLGGVNATGQTAFVILNLGSGQSSSVAPGKPEDDMAMFVADSTLRSKLSGGRKASVGGGNSKEGKSSAKLSWPFGKKD